MCAGWVRERGGGGRGLVDGRVWRRRRKRVVRRTIRVGGRRTWRMGLRGMLVLVGWGGWLGAGCGRGGRGGVVERVVV